MIATRRNFLKNSLAASTWCLTIASGLLAPLLARAGWPADKYARTDFNSAMSAILDTQKATASDKIAIKIPEVAENGAIVPITIYSDLEDTESIYIVADKNPVPLIAQFNFAPEMAKQVTARIKLAETCNVIAIVRAGDQFYSARRAVKVTVGGCGE